MASAVHMLGLESAPDTWIAFTLSLVFSWLRGWFYAGSGIESLLLLYGPPRHWSFSRYTLLLYLNVAYAIASTSWLFRAVFALSCWPLVLATCLVQYAAVSSFTRGRLRSLLKFVHFYQDRIAFFGLPSLVFDSGINGLMTIRGITFSILDLKLELHGIEIDLDLGSGHELSIHSDGITVNLFREIAIDEIYGVHWFDGQTKDKNLRNDSYVDDHCSSRSRSVSLKTKVPPDTSEERRDVIKDKIMSRSGNSQEDIEPHTKSPLDDNVRRNRIEKVLSRGDVEAEQRYNHVLSELRRTNHLHQCRSQAKNLDASRVSEHEDESRHRPVVCSNFRNSKPPRSSSENQIPLSSLMELLSPLSRLLDRAPIILRLFLWLLSQSHPVTCPAVCFSADGRYLGDEILESLFRKHAVEDSRIRQLKQEVSSWLSDADVYLDFMNLIGQSTVPVLTSNKITADLRSNGVALSRLGANITNGGRIGELSGVDAAFVIPTCLLPSHASIAPLPGKNENDTALVFMAIRASLPAHFSESFLNFAATLSKTSQMLDIEEEAGRIGNNKPACPGVDNQTTENVNHDQSHENESRTQRLREKLPHVHLGIATKHPVDHLKQSLHKRIKKTAVDKVDGAWFAKWTNKLLRQLEGLDGDVGYSTEIPVGITRDRE